MKMHILGSACLLALLPLVMPMPAGAQQISQQSRMKSCADEWNAMKAANQTAGKTYRAFQKECLARTAATPTAPTIAPPGTTPAAPAPKAKAAAGGRQAMVARERACAADWKAAKAAGTVPAGTKWPQYWSDCNKRKKAEGM